MKKVELTLVFIGFLIVLLLIGRRAFGHGEGKCDDEGYKISHETRCEPDNTNHQVYKHHDLGSDRKHTHDDNGRVNTGIGVRNHCHGEWKHVHYYDDPNDKDGDGVVRQSEIFDSWPTGTYGYPCNDQPTQTQTETPTTSDSDTTDATPDSDSSTSNDSDDNTIQEVSESVRGRQHTWNFDTDHYIGFPVIPDDVETVGDVRERFGMTHVWGYDDHNDLDNKFGAWNLNPDSVEITPHLGLSVSLRSGMVDIEGDLQYGEIVDLRIPDGQLSAGFLIGFPEVPVKYRSLTDLLRVDGVVSVIRKVRIDGKTQYITNDAAIVPGMAVMVRIKEDIMLDLRGEGVPAAPMIPRTLTTSWAAQKARR